MMMMRGQQYEVRQSPLSSRETPGTTRFLDPVTLNMQVRRSDIPPGTGYLFTWIGDSGVVEMPGFMQAGGLIYRAAQEVFARAQFNEKYPVRLKDHAAQEIRPWR